MGNFEKPLLMKYLLILVLLVSKFSYAQEPCENMVIITTDGYRWQELFNGADSSILFNSEYVKDTGTLKYMYWANTVVERRKKLMPFIWNYIAEKGQLWGNRNFNNKVSVANPYHFSYAGYNEILTGYADRAVITNKPRNNRNSNVLGYLQSLPQFQGKVAAFGSWKLLSYIINGNGNKIPLNAGYQELTGDSLTETEMLVNLLEENSADNELPTRTDLLTFSLATECMRKKHPRIIYISFGETDEFAHHGEYDNYLNQANMFDKMLAEIWSLVQSDDFYKNKTTLFITTDHGRGKKPAKWTTHGPLTSGSDETWLLQIGPNIKPLGEIRSGAEINNEQFAQTIASYLGVNFTAEHPVAEPLSLWHRDF